LGPGRGGWINRPGRWINRWGPGSLQDLLRVHRARGGQPENFHEKIAIQLNDTHPAIAVAELMRLLVDE
jgi:glucan phosphorylase